MLNFAVSPLIIALPQEEMPESGNSIKVMERTAPDKSVSFLQNTPYIKKTHTNTSKKHPKLFRQKRIL
jgi:hypothetical protein